MGILTPKKNITCLNCQFICEGWGETKKIPILNVRIQVHYFGHEYGNAEVDSFNVWSDNEASSEFHEAFLADRLILENKDGATGWVVDVFDIEIR